MRRVLTAVLAGAAGTAFAVGAGGVLYIKARNTQVLASTELKAKTLATLQPGDSVVWRGKADKDPWQKVTVKSGKATVDGVVLRSNLSATRPAPELVGGASAQPVDSRAFASSGAATRALGEGPKAYAETSEALKTAGERLDALEALARTVTNEEIAARNKAVGLPTVVGGGKGGTR